jgi:hypothetical protein
MMLNDFMIRQIRNITLCLVLPLPAELSKLHNKVTTDQTHISLLSSPSLHPVFLVSWAFWQMAAKAWLVSIVWCAGQYNL